MQEQMQEVSNVNISALVLLVVTGLLIWGLPRRYAICPLFAMICLMPLGQMIVVMGLHFQLFRVLLLIGMARVFVRGEASQLKLNLTDKIFLWWVAVSVAFGSLSNPSTALFINRAGDAYNALGSYFFVRCVIRDLDDFVVSIRTLAFLFLPVALLMLVEKTTSRNYLSVFGGVPEFTAIREGHLRCQAAFRHPILAGTFGAAAIPLFAALWFYQPRSRLLPFLAAVAGIIIAITASSSGALTAVLVSIGGLVLWKWRHRIRLIRWATVFLIIGLALIMNAPVWYLFARLSNIAGGTGWHRAWLIDQTISHFDEWWLFGTTYTAHWGPSGLVIATDPNMMDITNHYVMEGVKGGIVKLGLFLVIVFRSFQSIGSQIRVAPWGSPTQFFFWATGVSLFVHCVSFLSITYFDQTIVVWYWLLAVIAGSQSFVLADASDEAEQEAASDPRHESQEVTLASFQ